MKKYTQFQKLVFEGIQESTRLDSRFAVPHIPYGRCPRHPEVVTSSGMFDAVCGFCEAELDGLSTHLSLGEIDSICDSVFGKRKLTVVSSE